MVKKQIIEKLSVLLTAAFGFVAALAWNEAIQAIFKEFFGAQSKITAMLIYAVVVTIVAVIITVWIGKIAEKVK